jgi:hypothetical protein
MRFTVPLIVPTWAKRPPPGSRTTIAGMKPDYGAVPLEHRNTANQATPRYSPEVSAVPRLLPTSSLPQLL